MRNAKQNSAIAKKTEKQLAADPRLAAFARLLARHAAKRDLENGLRQSSDNDYDSNSPSGDKS